MTNINDFKEASEILQNVDVSEIFTSLALAVANTQSKLDENSIKQLVRLSEYKMGGKSLLELGFVPAFYCLSEASINAYISLKMATKELLDVKVGLNVSYSSGNNLDKTQTDFINKDVKAVDGYKSGKSLSFLASESNKVKIEDKDIEFNPKEKGVFKECVKMVEGYEDELNKIAAVSEVVTTIKIDQKVKSSPGLNICDTGNGYICISYPHKFPNDNCLVFKHTEKTGEKITNYFEISTEGFEKTLNNIATATNIEGVYAFSRDGKYYEFEGSGGTQKPKAAVDLSIYFNDGKEKTGDRILWDKSIKVGDTNRTNDPGVLIDKYKKLIHLLNVTGEPLTVAGYTVESDNAYIKSLGDKRAKAFAQLLKGMNIKKIETKSEKKEAKDIKAQIILNADYVVIDRKSVEPPKEDSFIKTDKNKEEGNAHIDYEEMLPHTKLEEIEECFESNKNLENKYLFEYRAGKNILYVLNKKAMLSFQLLSKDSSEIKVEAEKKPENENSILVKNDFSPASKLQTTSPDSKDSKSTFAIGANIDVRYSRQFEMSMEGNASMSAKMKSVPPPDEFKAFVLSTLK